MTKVGNTMLCFVLLTATIASGEENNAKQVIEHTLRALPEELRDGAAVMGYNASGQTVVLREGRNNIICWADNPNLSDARGAYFVNCYPKSLEAAENRRRELTAEMSMAGDWKSTMASEIKSGKLNMPDLAVRYTLRGHKAEAALALTVIHVPYSTTESSGFSGKPSNFRPWLMDGGTWNAHIMVPGN